MSIAEKLTTIAENEQKVYNAGYEKGKAEGGGGDNLMRYITGYTNLFSGSQFPQNTELEFTLNSGHTTELSGLFSGAKGLKSIKLIGGDEKVCSCTGIFGSLNDTEIIDISELKIKIGGGINFFLNDHKLKTVIGEIDFSYLTSTVNFFINCSGLENVRFKEKTLSVSLSLSHSEKLTAESIQSIIDGLADLTGGTAQTLTVHATVGAKITDEQKAAISAKNWTLTY